MKAAIYARVSTLDQEPENQLAELRRYAAARGWSVLEYVDRGVSGAKDRRPALDQMVAEARRRRFDAVVCWRLDRLPLASPVVLSPNRKSALERVLRMLRNGHASTDQRHPHAFATQEDCFGPLLGSCDQEASWPGPKDMSFRVSRMQRRKNLTSHRRGATTRRMTATSLLTPATHQRM